MSTANTALVYNLGLLGTPLVEDNLIGGAAGTQAAGVPVRGELVRSTGGAVNNSYVLKSILTGDACAITFVINDGPNACKVFCAPGETMGGVANSSLTIPAGQSGIFVRVPNSLGTPDWRAAVIP